MNCKHCGKKIHLYFDDRGGHWSHTHPSEKIELSCNLNATPVFGQTHDGYTGESDTNRIEWVAGNECEAKTGRELWERSVSRTLLQMIGR